MNDFSYTQQHPFHPTNHREKAIRKLIDKSGLDYPIATTLVDKQLKVSEDRFAKGAKVFLAIWISVIFLSPVVLMGGVVGNEIYNRLSNPTPISQKYR
tara:strand:+ start:1476 stop:1769 length:294 start_codon:yes stop_codon:yes gene_type:complete